MKSIIQRSELYIKFLKQCDIPPRSMSYFAQFALYEFFSRASIRVALDGQGADELFGGYLKKSLHFAYEGVGFLTRFMELSRNLWLFRDKRLLLKFIFGMSDRSYREHIRDLRMGHLQYLVHFLDINSAYFGIEVRVPYLTAFTYLSVENIHSTQAIKKGLGKYPIRKLASIYLGDLAWVKRKFGFRAGINLPDLSVIMDVVSLDTLMTIFPSIKSWEEYSHCRSIQTDWVLVKASIGCKFNDIFYSYDV